MENALNYYGIDWVAMVLTFFAIYYLGNKERKGFILMMTGNLCWVALGFLVSSLGLIIANAIFFSMNLRGLLRWSRPALTPA